MEDDGIVIVVDIEFKRALLLVLDAVITDAVFLSVLLAMLVGLWLAMDGLRRFEVVNVRVEWCFCVSVTCVVVVESDVVMIGRLLPDSFNEIDLSAALRTSRAFDGDTELFVASLLIVVNTVVVVKMMLVVVTRRVDAISVCFPE